MTRVLALADDLTGALEVGALFALAGMQSVVTARDCDGCDDPVVVIDTETRHADPQQAESIVASIVERRPANAPALIYKKTDSTLRGNIGAELRALHRLYGGPIAYVPAYPAMGRTVINGAVFVHGVPLAESSFAQDALNPITSGNVRDVLDPACECIVFDGELDGDVRDAARAILASRDIRVVAGPAAIAGALAAAMGMAVGIAWPQVGRCLVVNGSRHEVSLHQMESAVFDDDWQRFEPAVSTSADPLEVAQATGRQVCQLLDREPYDALLVFGGDTAFGILRGLGLPFLRPIGEILPGVPVARIDGRREVLITKAGGFGAPDLLARLRSALHA